MSLSSPDIGFWRERARCFFELPWLELVSTANQAHRENHPGWSIQKCALLSVKTGGCPEDCAYCPQSAHYETSLDQRPLSDLDDVRREARAARRRGAERFCIGAAWRSPRNGPEFDRVLEMVRAIKSEGLEACATLGMLAPGQARRLKEAGLDAYNHNLDTSRSHYEKIITTRAYDDRLSTLQAARGAGLTLCSGGILGLGESDSDRIAFLAELASLDPQPESVPINLLIPVAGTPLAGEPPVDPFDLVRVVAAARCLMPRSKVRLSAGRLGLSRETQALSFLAGANSIFLGDRLLTRPNPAVEDDEELLSLLTRPLSRAPGATACDA